MMMVARCDARKFSDRIDKINMIMKMCMVLILSILSKKQNLNE